MLSEKTHRVQPESDPGLHENPHIAAEKPVLAELHEAARRYPAPAGGEVCHALRGVSLTLHRGQLTALVGPSGSGKSTLLNLLSGIDRPTSGSIVVDGWTLTSRSEDALARYRASSVGIVFQSFQLLPTLTVLENVMLPMELLGRTPNGERAERARRLLERVGVEDQAHKLPSALSGGQQQRVAIARALANDPPLLVADEPTGNLDSHTAACVLDVLAGLAQGGTAVLIATHDGTLLPRFDRVITLKDGAVVDDIRRSPSAVPEMASADAEAQRNVPTGASRCSV